MIDHLVLNYSWYIATVCLIIPQFWFLNWANKYARYFYINCLIRGFFPRIDVSRTCFFGGFISSVIVGRTLATVGELSLVICVQDYIKQNLLVYRRYQRHSFMSVFIITILVLINYLVFFLAVLAEIYSWTSVIYRDNTYHIYEESIWLTMGVYTFIMSWFFRESIPRDKNIKFNNQMCIITLFYIIYMLLIDIPRYQQRALDQAPPTSFNTGFWELFECQKISQDFKDYAVSFHLLYFGIAPYILDKIVFQTRVIEHYFSRNI